MKNEKLLLTISELIQLRKWEEFHFPRKSGRVFFEISLIIVQYYLEEKILTSKILKNSLPYSEKTISVALNNLSSDGFCEITKKTDDRRVAVISANEKLVKKFMDFQKQLYL